ncbi:MAG: polymerase subunit alpha, polymerase subunit alpha protein [Candidatus Kaiserbacteria bacterium]|nr:polymerase subunit alpha, polymerase subunit alpha protein [Candidatus Kaiserbacteria bacterium]
MSSQFSHLHVHSHYSLLEALAKVEDLVDAAVADGQTSLALTDNGNMYASIDMYKACKKAGINPIIGVDFFVAPRRRQDQEHRVDDHTFRLVLLAKDFVGYQNLMKLVSRSYTEGFFHRPRLDRELIQELREGLIAILPSIDGEHARAMHDNAADRAGEVLDWYKKIFGEDLFVEITRHPNIPGHEANMQKIIAKSREQSIPIVATHDVYYMQPDDATAHKLVDHIRTGTVLNRDVDAAEIDHSFVTQEQMYALFADLPDAIANTQVIAERCNLELVLGKAIFPVFPIPEGTTDNAELRKLAESGIAMRGFTENEILRTRIEYELGIIEKKGYASYFLIVADLLRFARESGIYTNTRGSAAGSLVSYLCGITTVDPIKFNMPFERFLNPERPSAPDIDMDIADDRRDELIDYARRTYDNDHVVQIGTFGTMLARAAVRDVSRALGFSYGIGDKIAKMIPFPKQGFPVYIKGALEEVPELAEVYKRDGDARDIIDLALKVEGNARHVGVHAAGVIIAPASVVSFTPIQPDPKGGKTITQYDMYSITDEYGGVGLLKFDFLGLKNLSVLADSVLRVKTRLDTIVDLEKVTLEDRKVYEMLSRGETLGVFQMAGSGMTSQLKELRPTSIFDLSAMVALYRPGPMAFIPDYIQRKRNPRLVTYLDPRLEAILKPTYGILIYQDDVMMIAVQLAGYSWGDADKFRKAMGKKIPAEMAAQKDKFIKGCNEGGMKPANTQKLWEQIETFAAYGFNKAHAASYGGLAYKTAYMKANFPVDYMAAVLTADAGEVEKISEIVDECKHMGITVLPPSINESRGTFTVAGETTIRFGLYSIKNFGTGVADSIIAARENGGPFADIADFLTRIPDRNLNKRQLESLIECGALDDLPAGTGVTCERGSLLASLDTLLQYHREQTHAPSNQNSLFGGMDYAKEKPKVSLASVAPATQDQRLIWEKELLGLYVSGHPLDKHRAKFADEKKSIKHTKEKLKGLETVIAGFVETVQTILTKKGDKMAFLKVSDFSDAVEVVIFPKILAEFQALIQPGNCIALKGRLSERSGEASFVADKIKAL